MARVLVTGAGGFVGANVARALAARGDEVYACVRQGSNTWRLRDVEGALHMHDFDITDAESIENVLRASKPGIVYHLVHYGGNRGQNDWAMIARVIVEGTTHLYEACVRHNVTRIINTGSSSEYGPCNEPMREDMTPQPNTDYGRAKLTVTRFGETFSRERGIPVTTLRLFSAYGPYESAVRFFPAVILALMNGALPALAAPETVRDFVHVEDVVAAFLQAAQRPAGVYNVGTGIETTLQDALGLIQVALGTSGAPQWGKNPGRGFDTAHWRADTSLGKREFGWEARISIEEGVGRTVDWFRAHRDLYA